MIYACMLYNVRLHKTLQITHHEAFHGKIPDLSKFPHLWLLGICTCCGFRTQEIWTPNLNKAFSLGPEVNGPGYKVLTYNEKLKT
jgi:hypothetical protein